MKEIKKKKKSKIYILNNITTYRNKTQIIIWLYTQEDTVKLSFNKFIFFVQKKHYNTSVKFDFQTNNISNSW